MGCAECPLLLISLEMSTRNIPRAMYTHEHTCEEFLNEYNRTLMAEAFLLDQSTDET